MHKSEVQTLSCREIQILSNQNGILFCRYRLENRTMECLSSFFEERFGVSALIKNMPETAVDNGFISYDTKTVFYDFFDEILRGIPSGNCNIKIRGKNDEYRWHHADYSLVNDGDTPQYALISFYDNQEEHELKLATEKWYTNLTSLLSEAVLYAELNVSRNEIERIDSSQKDLIHGIPIETMEDMLPFGMQGEIDTETRNEYFAFFNRQRFLNLYNVGVQEDFFEYSLKTDDGSIKWLRATVSMIRYPYSDDVMAVISFIPLENRQKELERISHKAFHDPLTGLLNRDGIELYTQKSEKNCEPQLSTALFMIDLDNFKQINDHLGHQMGDMVLRQVAEALKTSFHQTDIVGRIGGDEFIVLLSGNMGTAFLKEKALKLIAATKLFYGEKQDIAISMSIGIAFGQGQLTFDKLYRAADLALYSAKKAGKCRYHLTNTDTNESECFNEPALEPDLVSLQSLLEKAVDEVVLAEKIPYKTLLQNIPCGVVVFEIGKTLQVTHCNKWYYRFSGYSKEELDALHQKDQLATVHRDDVHILTDAINSIRNGSDSLKITYRVCLKNGTYKHIVLSASTTERTENSVVIYGVYFDVDESRVSYKKPLLSEQMFGGK